ncbi:hypothetical protein [Sediminitomix flava]|uniref:Uncharacterized protein n=1 Tax=Sediminitomix flava TaxID=379075 RepID=A0A315YVF9_SEDFL|nr:hypothetical protein [Sediminitomix flava]PWJ33508.1 hypothetical protein BC781_11310 [Sediminitomix flava]
MRVLSIILCLFVTILFGCTKVAPDRWYWNDLNLKGEVQRIETSVIRNDSTIISFTEMYSNDYLIIASIYNDHRILYHYENSLIKKQFHIYEAKSDTVYITELNAKEQPLNCYQKDYYGTPYYIEYDYLPNFTRTTFFNDDKKEKAKAYLEEFYDPKGFLKKSKHYVDNTLMDTNYYNTYVFDSKGNWISRRISQTILDLEPSQLIEVRKITYF